MSLDLPGDLLIFLACVSNLLVGVLFFLIARGKNNLVPLAKRFYHLFTILTSIAVVYLYYLFFSGAYINKYVYSYSDSTLSFFYTLSAFWGGQEGTYLLWLFMNALFGYVLLKSAGQYRNYAMVIYSTVNLFFLVLLIRLSPFAVFTAQEIARMGVGAGGPLDGAGLNPLLQNPWMVIHPPVIFVGYSVAAIPFSLAMAALLKNDFSDWVRKAFPWVAIAALMLAAGNILGGYWAYITLGWGGFWAWDPVENSSFIPWFASLALLHGMIIENRTGALRKTNILLTAFLFNLIVYGTFLTRSGVLSDFSVHSFVDLGINQYLVGFMAFFFVMTWAFFIPRIKSMGHIKITYNIYNKEFVIFAGMVLLFLFSMLVLFWTSLPILTGIFTTEPRAADLATYNNLALPMAIVFALWLAVAPLANYSSYKLEDWVKKLVIFGAVGAVLGFGGLFFALGTNLVTAIVFTIVFTGLSLYLFKKEFFKPLMIGLAGFVAIVVISILLGVTNYEYLLFYGMSALLVVTNLFAIFRYIPHQWKTAGAQITHFGFGLMLIGILSSSAYSTNQKLVLPRGDVDQAYGLNIKYTGMENTIETPKNKLLIAFNDGGDDKIAKPELYFSQRMNSIFRKPYVKKNLLNDIYFSPEQIQEMSNDQRMMLKLDSPLELNNYTFIFRGYEMGGGHGESDEMKVIAKVDLIDGADTTSLEPAVVVGAESENPTDIPAGFGSDEQYQMTISQILVEQHAVALTVPGLTGSGAPDRLILDISKKPLINLVWLGTTLILLGSIIVFIRRKSELSVS